MIQPSQKIAYVAVGSNIEPEHNIREALKALLRFETVSATSTFYLNAPLGRPQQPMFINGVWQLKTKQPPGKLKLDLLRSIENGLGRVRTSDSHAPRTIDLDLILHGDLMIDEPGLKIPDPFIRTRPFIALPLLELAPNLVIPGADERLSSLPIVNEKAGLKALHDFTQHLRKQIEQ